MTGQSSVKQVLWRETGWEWALAPGPFGGQPADQLPADLALAATPHWLPASARLWRDHQARALPYEVRETANRAEGADLTTYLTPAYALGPLEERGRLFAAEGDNVYEGQLIGIHSKDNDLTVNAIKTKPLTNMRASGKDDAIKLTPAIK